MEGREQAVRTGKFMQGNISLFFYYTVSRAAQNNITNSAVWVYKNNTWPTRAEVPSATLPVCLISGTA
jgi:hypothetical protein